MSKLKKDESNEVEVFKIGDIVTLKSHPLFRTPPQKIIEFSAQVPPLMLVKEVLFENEDKKRVYSDTIKGAKIADVVKYDCVYFNANKSEFEEKTVYHSLLRGYSDLKYFRNTEVDNSKEDKIDLISEVSNYNLMSDYEYGKVVQFKTKKLERRKSYATNGEKIHGVSFQTPDFVLIGIKNEEQKDLFFPNGKPKRIISSRFYKITWYNHHQLKYSEYLLPEKSLVEGLEM